MIILSLSMLLLGTNSAASATPPPPAGAPIEASPTIPQDPHEGPLHDPYLPPDPRAPRTLPAVSTWRLRTGVQIAQVNVDANGLNITGDAANEPSIAVHPFDPSRIAIGWRQFDNVASSFRQAGWAYTQDGGVTWTFPGVIEPGVFRSDPVLGYNAEGVFFYNSLQGTFECTVFQSVDGGATWDTGTDAQGGDKQWMAIDRTGGTGHGHIYASWSHSASSCDGQFTRSIDGGLSYPDCLPVPGSPRWGTMTVGPDGEVYVVGITGVVAKSTTVQNASLPIAWDFATWVDMGGVTYGWSGPNPGGLTGQAWIATNHAPGPHRGDVYVLGSVEPWASPDPSDIMFTRSTDGGITWQTPVRVNDDANDSAWQWFGAMSAAPNGRIDVVWNDTRNHPGSYVSELYYACSMDGGQTFSANEQLTPAFNPHLGWPNQNKLGDYCDMVSDVSGFGLAFAATFNGEQDVYYLRYGPPADADCNQNGIPDLCDIDCGPVGGICDLPGCGGALDCNHNLVPDVCDIATGNSFDEDADGVPDECQLTRLFVDANAAGAGSGSCWANAFTRLTDALERARPAHAPVTEIWVAQGVYTPAGPGGSRYSTFRLPSGAALLGGFAGGETTADQRQPALHPTILSGDLNNDDTPDPASRGDNAYHVVTADSTATNVSLDGFVVIGGHSETETGGGLHATAVPLTVHNCAFLGNQAEAGGGAALLDGAQVTFDDCLFAGNAATVVGAAGVVATAATAGFTNCTFVHNSASSTTGGVYVSGSASTAALRNAILWHNSDYAGSDESAQLQASGGGAIAIDHSCVMDWTGALGGVGNHGDDPLFVDPAGVDGVFGTLDDNDRLTAGSACVNAGDPAVVFDPTRRDLDFHPRVLCGRVDMGAYEFGIGDHDCNGAIDMADYAALQNCYTGPFGALASPACAAFDFNADSSVTTEDFAAFHALLTP